MSDKKGLPFPLIIIAFVLGWSIFKQFDVEACRFEKPVLTIVYMVAFVLAIYLIVKQKKEN